MASNLYNKGMLRLLDGSVSFLNSTIACAVVDNTYAFDETHEYLSNISGEVSGTGYSRLSLSGKTVSLNSSTNTVVFDCDNLVFSSVNTSAYWAGLVVYQSSGADATSPLLGFVGTQEVQTDGSDVELTVDSNGIFNFTNNIA